MMYYLIYTGLALVAILTLIHFFRESLRKAYYRWRYPNAVIPCALCPEHIFPDMPVHLVIFRDDYVPTRPGEVAIEDPPGSGNKRWMCCPYCADTIADYSGTWELDPTGHGRFVRHESALEAACRTGRAVISDGRGHNQEL